MEDEQRKKYMDYLRSREHDEWFTFECILRRMSLLGQFAQVIDRHPDELDPSYQAVIKEQGIKPSEPLADFVLLDIRNFYGAAYKRFGKSLKYPPSWSYVKELRDDTVAHFTKETPKEVVEAYQKIQEIGFDAIWKEFNEFTESLRRKIFDSKKP